MNALLAFYRGEGPDDRGRMLTDILQQDDAWLERTHDYVQWLFPLVERSRVNRDAPLLDADTATAFRNDQALRQQVFDAYVRMLAFFGLTRMPDGRVVKGPSWHERKRHWFTRDSHNSLRITRILKSLALLGLVDDSRAFRLALATLCTSEPGCDIASMSRAYWRHAIPDEAD